MTARARINLILVLLGIALVAVVAWWVSTHLHQVPYEHRTPPTAEARRNRLLALERTLQARGHQVFDRLRFDTADFGPAGESAIVLDTDPSALGASDAKTLLDFVERGALLWLRMPDSAKGEPGPLLDALGVVPMAADAHCVEVDIAPKRTLPLCNGTRIGGEDLASRFTRLARDDATPEGFWYAHAAHGKGAIILMRQFDFLHNSELDSRDAAALAAALLAPLRERSRVHLFRGVDHVPLHVLLLRHGYAALLPLLVALLLLVWQGTQRFGPILPPPPTERRALLEHVRGSGEFLFRRGQAMAMHRALLARVQRRLAEREPGLVALPETQRFGALATRSKIPEADLRFAFQPVGLGRTEAFFRAISTLTQLEHRL